MATYTSDPVSVTDGSTTEIIIPSNVAVTSLSARWKGVSTTSQQSASTTRTASGYSSAAVSIGSGEWMISGTASCWVSDPDSPGGTWYWNSAPQGTIYPGQTISRSYSMGTNPTAGNYMGCSVPAYYGINISVNVGYYYTVENKTNDPWFYVGSDQENYAWYDGLINNGQWCDYIAYSAPSVFVPGSTHTVHHEIEGSGSAYFQYVYDYGWNHPTLIKTMKVQVGSTIYTLPLVDPADPALEYNFMRAQLGSTVYCVDVVDTDDSEASPVRVQKGSTVYALRKVV